MTLIAIREYLNGDRLASGGGLGIFGAGVFSTIVAVFDPFVSS